MLVLSARICRGRRFDHARMTVTHVWNVVVGVDVAPPGLVEEVLHRAADHLQRPPIADADVAADEPPARRENLVVGHPRRSRIAASAGNVRRIGCWLTARYSSSDRCACCHAAMHALMQSRRHANGNTAARSSLQQWMLGLISAHHCVRDGERIGGVEHRIRDGDGRIGDRPTVDHVAEVDDADDFGSREWGVGYGIRPLTPPTGVGYRIRPPSHVDTRTFQSFASWCTAERRNAGWCAAMA